MNDYDTEPEKSFVCNGCEERTEQYKDSDYCKPCFEEKADDINQDLDVHLSIMIAEFKDLDKKCDKLGIDRVSTEFIKRFTAAFEKP